MARRHAELGTNGEFWKNGDSSSPAAESFPNSLTPLSALLIPALWFAAWMAFAPLAMTAAPLAVMPEQSAQSAPPASTLGLIQELIAQGRLDEARQELRNALRTFPHEAALENFLGVVNAEQRQEAAAEQCFRKAIQESPHYAGAYLNLAHLYQTTPGHRAQAIETYRDLLKFDPSDVEANYQSALLELEQGAFRESLAHLGSLPAADQQKPQALAVACADDALIEYKSRALFCLSQLLASPELTEADVLPTLETLEAHRRTDFAIRALEGLRNRHLASDAALENLGTLYTRGRRFEDARQTFEELAQHAPNSTEPLLELAHVATLEHDDRGALGYLAHARAIDPANARVHFLFGMICVRLELDREAYDSLKRAVELDPSKAAYNYALGAACTDNDKPQDAIRYFEKYCALKPGDPRGKLALGVAYYFSSEPDSARPLLAQLTQNPVTAAGAYCYLGRIDIDRLNWTAAARNLEEAIHRDPQYADAYAALGDVYLHEKEYVQAEAAITHALRLQPGHYLANRDLMLAYERTKDPRARVQAQRFATAEKRREQRAKWFLRTIEIVP